MFPIDQISGLLLKEGDAQGTAKKAATVVTIILIAIIVVVVMKYMSKDKYVVGGHRGLVGHSSSAGMGHNHGHALRYTKHAGQSGTIDDTFTRATDNMIPGGGHNLSGRTADGSMGHNTKGGQDEYYDADQLSGFDDYSQLNCNNNKWGSEAIAEAAALEEVMGQSAMGSISASSGLGQPGKSDAYYAEAMRGRM